MNNERLTVVVISLLLSRWGRFLGPNTSTDIGGASSPKRFGDNRQVSTIHHWICMDITSPLETRGSFFHQWVLMILSVYHFSLITVGMNFVVSIN
jgi:hypothetical protein